MDDVSALVPSPFARMLLELGERRATGRINVGGRVVVLRSGQVAEVTAAPSDPPLDRFFVEAGRLTNEAALAARAEAERDDKPIEHVLKHRMPMVSFASGVRAAWLDRLVFGIDEDARAGRGLHDFEPVPSLAAEPLHEAGLVELLLDALARRAGEQDAGRVGRQASRRLEFRPGPHQEASLKWSDLGMSAEDPPPRIASLLSTSPAAASRIAALLRSDLAFVSDDEAPSPPQRRSTIAPPPSGGMRVSLRPNASAPTAPRASGEGTGSHAALPVGLDLVPPLAPVVATLADPLDGPEKRIANLEAASAPDAERCQAWLDFGRAWQRHHRSLEEATRAFREAAAADPSDYGALYGAASLCIAMGRADLGDAYARAAAAVGQGKERGAANRLLALTARRDGDLSRAADALRAAVESDPNDVASWEELARLLYKQQSLAGAAVAAEEAADRLRRPARARAWRAWVRTFADDPDRTARYAKALADDGLGEAAITELSLAARKTEDPHLRMRFVLEAAEHAELIDRPDLSAGLLLDAFDSAPEIDVLHDPLASDMAQSHAPEQVAVVLEAIAAVGEVEDDMRATWLAAAADAHAEGGDSRWANELYTRALIADPAAEEPLAALRLYAERVGEPSVLLDALERVGRFAAPLFPEATSPLLAELAEQSEAADCPHRAIWAWRTARDVCGLTGANAHIQALADKVREKDGLLQRAQADVDVAATDGQEWSEATLRLGLLLRDVPAARANAISIHRRLLARADGEVADKAEIELMRLLRLEGRDEELADVLAGRADSHEGVAIIPVLAQLAGLFSLAGDAMASADAAMKILSVEPAHRVAIARLDQAARRTDSIELRRRALNARLSVVDDSREAARLCCLLALGHEDADEHGKAVDAARRALALDPRATDALAIVLQHIDSVPPNEAMTVLENAREACGETVALHEARVVVAQRAQDHAETLAALDALYRLGPNEDLAHRRIVEACAVGDARAISERAEQALSPACMGGRSLEGIDLALDRLESLGELTEGARIALLALDVLGERRLLKRVWGLARRSDDAGAKIAAIERIIAWTAPEDRLDPLRRLASIHRENGDRAAEARTLLRVLAEDPHDPPTLERLTHLYAETGETERLLAVLALCLETAKGTTARVGRLLQLAAACVQRGDDRERARGFVDQAVEELHLGEADAKRTRDEFLQQVGISDNLVHELLAGARATTDPSDAADLYAAAVASLEQAGDGVGALDVAAEGLRFDPPHPELLVSFERVAHAMGAVERAQRMFNDLCDRAMGPHGLRGLRYRQARWLEAAGSHAPALRAYSQAFALAPGEGVVFHAIERLTEQESDAATMVDALEALEQRASLVDRKLELAERAAHLAERELGDPARAFRALNRTYAQTNRSELLPELRRLGNIAAAEHLEDVEAMRNKVIETLRNRIEMSWDAPDQIACLSTIASIEGGDRNDLDAEGAVADEAVAIADKEEEGYAEARDLLRAYVERLLDAGRDADARARSAVADRLDELAPDASEEPTHQAPPDEGLSEADDWGGVADDLADVPETAVGVKPAAGSDSSTATQAPTAAETNALVECIETIVAEPWQVGAIRRAKALAEQAGIAAVVSVCSEVLDLIDHGTVREAPRTLDLTLPDAQAHRDGTLDVELALFAEIWQGALPLFRRTLRQYGAADGRRVSGIGDRPLAVAVRTALKRIAPGGAAVYACDPSRGRVDVAPTNPPSVLVGTVDGVPSRILFRVARGLDFCRAEHVLIATRGGDEGRLLASSVVAAFGPHESGKSADGEAKALAAELWQTIPGRDQEDIRYTLKDGRTPDFDVLWGEAEARAARAALLCCGSISAAVSGLFADDFALDGLDADGINEEVFTQGCEQSPGLASVIRFAFSDAFLTAIDAWLTDPGDEA